MADRDRLRHDREAGHGTLASLREHVVEEDRVQAPDNEIGERMHVVLVRDGVEPDVPLGLHEDFVRDRPAQRPDGLAAKVGKRADAVGVGAPDAQDLAKFVVGHSDRQARAPRRRVFDTAEADLGVAPIDRLVDGRELDVDELRRTAERARQEVRDLDIEAHERVRLRRIGLHERRAAFGVAGPAKGYRSVGGAGGRQKTERDQNNEQQEREGFSRAHRRGRL